jgi:hypothetical protein
MIHTATISADIEQEEKLISSSSAPVIGWQLIKRIVSSSFVNTPRGVQDSFSTVCAIEDDKDYR